MYKALTNAFLQPTIINCTYLINEKKYFLFLIPSLASSTLCWNATKLKAYLEKQLAALAQSKLESEPSIIINAIWIKAKVLPYFAAQSMRNIAYFLSVDFIQSPNASTPARYFIIGVRKMFIVYFLPLWVEDDEDLSYYCYWGQFGYYFYYDGGFFQGSWVLSLFVFAFVFCLVLALAAAACFIEKRVALSILIIFFSYSAQSYPI